MSKWKTVPVNGAHDWDGDLKTLLETADDSDSDAPIEIDWNDPAEIAAAREMVADALLPSLAEALQGIAGQFADVPPVGRLAILGGIADATETLEAFMGPVVVSQVKPGGQRVRAALDLTDDDWTSLAEQAGEVGRTVTEARECGCGRLHACELADGSALFVGVRNGKPPEFCLAPWWKAEEAEDE